MGTVVAMFSLGGSPGVTTLATALAGMWPFDVPALMVEADAKGGDLASWRGLSPVPGVVELAAAVRHDTTAEAGMDAVERGQELPGGLRVCLAPASAERAFGAVSLLAQHPHALRPSGDAVSVVDLGRMALRSPAARLAVAANAAVLVTSDDVAQLKRVKESLPALRSGLSHLGVAVVGEREPAGEVADLLQAPVWAQIPRDPRGAALVRGERGDKRPQRRALMAAARRLGQRLAMEITHAGPHVEAVQTL